MPKRHEGQRGNIKVRSIPICAERLNGRAMDWSKRRRRSARIGGRKPRRRLRGRKMWAITTRGRLVTIGLHPYPRFSDRCLTVHSLQIWRLTWIHDLGTFTHFKSKFLCSWSCAPPNELPKTYLIPPMNTEKDENSFYLIQLFRFATFTFTLNGFTKTEGVDEALEMPRTTQEN